MEPMSMQENGVLIVSPFFSPNIGGVETHLDDLCAFLSKKSRKVFVLTYSPLTVNAKAKFFEKKGTAEITRIPWIGGNLFHKLEKFPLLEFAYLSPVLFLAGFFFLLFNSKKIKAIHAQGFNAAFVAKFLGLIFRKRIIASTHAIYDLDEKAFFSKMIKWVLESFDLVLTLSKPSKKELEKIGLNPEKIKVYTYWVDQKAFSPKNKERCRKKTGLAGKKFAVFFVGRLIEKKGALLLLKIAKEMPEATFAFAGTGPVEGMLEKAQKELKNVVFFGKINNKKLPEYYCSADIAAVPSLYNEGFGRVILEALSCGIPVVASNLGAIPDAVGKGCGFVVKPEPKAFKEAIRKFYLQRKLLPAISRKCRLYALRNFSEKNAELIEKSYDE
jgi:glycosyltransferase involved in cell wall biosynthesis